MGVRGIQCHWLSPGRHPGGEAPAEFWESRDGVSKETRRNRLREVGVSETMAEWGADSPRTPLAWEIMQTWTSPKHHPQACPGTWNYPVKNNINNNNNKPAFFQAQESSILGSEERGGFCTSAISLVHRTSEISVVLVWPPEASPSDPSLLFQYHCLCLPQLPTVHHTDVLMSLNPLTAHSPDFDHLSHHPELKIPIHPSKPSSNVTIQADFLTSPGLPPN